MIINVLSHLSMSLGMLKGISAIKSFGDWARCWVKVIVDYHGDVILVNLRQ